jgi:hypothetical protein
MPRVAAFPFLILMTCAALAWAVAKYAELRQEWQQEAGLHPRSRPFPQRCLVVARRR